MGVTANIFTVFMVVKLQDPNVMTVELVTIGKALRVTNVGRKLQK